ncbi:hypothetical protein BGW38_000371 [Lunasporangiospora selenospora]|uniref:ABC-type multidrug transport system, ATPase and permease component n=1 Tax=Lunasporangiospora selenospora TaxID=979761 RepID=A0A9P6G344_9FUNG|nr:hypothetical protein BGW38_000371 [Lunasporangiospora selenospora]
MDPLRHLLGFSVSIALAFLVEIWPRTNTRVQRESREKERLTAYDQANLFSRLSFHYAQRIMSIGAKRPLTADDVNEKTPYDLRTQVNYLIVEHFWSKRVSKFFHRHPQESHLQQRGSRSCCGLLRRKRSAEEQAKYAAKRATGPSLVLAILDAYKWRIIPTMFIRMLSFALLFVAPFLFSYLLRFFSDYAEAQKKGKTPPPMAQGLLLAVGIFLSTAAQGLLLSMSSNELSNICIGARAALISMIYRKSMRLSPSARQKSTLGEITNHMAVDAESWMAAQNMLPLVLTIPLELTLCSILLYRLLGWSLFAGVAVFFIITPIQTRLGKKMHTSQREKLKLMDGRLRLLTEILSNIKIIKLYAWDDAFKDKVDGLRAKELKAQKALSTIRSILMIVFSSISLLIILATFITYVNFGGPNFTPAKMTSEVIFVGITLFAMLSRPLGLVPVTFSHIIMLANANRRIQRFLLLEEIDIIVVQRRNRDDNAREDSSAVMYKLGGSITTFGEIAYVPQQAWIINASVRDNILLGKPFDQELYDRVVYASGLTHDLGILQAGDQTEIGERGINLSGGQKQRVSLARAAYQDADVYLMDDPLSAVDAHVDQHLWQHLIGPQGLLRNKSRILVTHGIHHLEEVDQIVVVKDGTITETGHYNDLMQSQQAFYQIMVEFSASNKNTGRQDNEGLIDNSKDIGGSQATISQAVVNVSKSTNGSSNGKVSNSGALVGAEKVESGKVGWGVYLAYIKAIMGRIINRFSTDVSAIDSQLSEQLPGLLSFSSQVFGIIFVISYSTPIFLVAVPPLLIIFLLVLNYYVKASGSLKRLYSVSKSPLHQHFSETLAGVSTIRSIQRLEDQFLQENETRSDLFATRANLFLLTNRWLTIRLQALCALLILLTASLAVLNADRLDHSLVGLALSYALNMTNVLGILVRCTGEVQNHFVSVERIEEYCHKPVEAPVETGYHVSESWPEHGKVEFKHFSARYREGLDLCIRDANFTVEPQEKVGIVGRTGAGKSSLTLALFRIIEAADSFWALVSDPSQIDHIIDSDAFAVSGVNGSGGGSIEIDGVDISRLGLRDLRSRLAIIPQEPTLFSGTIRENLDPFKKYDDSMLWGALERAHMKDYIIGLEGGLAYEVAQGGENFSVGQRSLLCLARALLRKSKILVLDEATAAVDVETDNLIQKTIHKEFKDRTILTIAHRIKTVKASDKILVLEQARVREFETPSALLERRDSLFYTLAQHAGEI